MQLNLESSSLGIHVKAFILSHLSPQPKMSYLQTMGLNLNVWVSNDYYKVTRTFLNA